ncbi:NHLP-related RiPP peptide [Stenotrophomonas sp.]|uniref:NHLP-related RiPP peptide n=1 Tax=Stenotrophomonas sp. TaxID=69392 RepID=UPI0028A2A068|nr:NHLP-related RiPP peptide [Stenotrophomonas sp.]
MSLPSLDAGVARRLIDRLSSDDGFRALFARNPGNALLQVGFDAERHPEEWKALSVCFLVGELASKEAIFAARSEIDTMLTAGLGQIVPALDANLDHSHTLKKSSWVAQAA